MNWTVPHAWRIQYQSGFKNVVTHSQVVGCCGTASYLKRYIPDGK
jgi:hypothetical protein